MNCVFSAVAEAEKGGGRRGRAGGGLPWMWGFVAPALAAVSGAAEPIARERVHPGPASSRFLSSPLDTPLRFCPLWDWLLLSGSSLDHSEREKIKPCFLTQRMLSLPEHQVLGEACTCSSMPYNACS